MTTTDNGGVDEAASTSSPSAPAQRPHLWIMWANVALSWSGLALLYLMFLTFKNIRWARRNSQPWFRYAAPLATLASAIVVLGILGSLITSSDLRNPAQATPLGNSNSAVNAPLARNSANAPASPTLEAIMKERIDTRAKLCRSVAGVVTTGSGNDTEGAAYTAWYETMRQAGLRHDPRVLACAIEYLSPSEIPDALPHFQKLFQTYRPLDAAHQLGAFSLDNAAVARKVTSGMTGASEINLTFVDGHSVNELVGLRLIDGIWLWDNFVL